MKYIETKNAPLPAGHYSQAVAHNGLLYVSGQLPVNPGTIEEQTQQVLNNLEAILLDSGSSTDRVIKTTVYISDISLWDRVNRIYAEFFGRHKPARAIVPTRELHHGFQIEVEAVAALY